MINARESVFAIRFVMNLSDFFRRVTRISCCSSAFLLLSLGCLAFSVSGQLVEEPDFLPVDEAYPTEVELTEDGDVVARWVMPDGYYLYRHALKLEGKDGTVLGEVAIPDGIAKVDEFFGEVEVYYNFLEISAPVLSQTQSEVVVDVHFQGCADAGLCYPPEVQEFRLSLPNTDSGDISTSAPTGTLSSGVSIWVAIGSALLAGLILNLMPCVFPVLSIKAISMLQSTVEVSHLRHAVGYLTGVVATFLLLAFVLIALRSLGAAVGWGFQLQSPGFVAAMSLLFVLMSLNLLGVIEIPGFGISGGQPNPFMTGVLAVIVATPCTVPFMAAAIGYAITQGGFELALIMAMMGIGMALPYVLVTATPRVANLLPRPGKWMSTIKRIMAIPLVLTVIWLEWVLVRQAGYAGLIWSIVAMGLLIGAAFVGRNQVRWLASVWALMLVVIAGTVYAVSLPNESDESSPAKFDLTSFNVAVKNERPIFLNVTADWCLTCLANERTTLSRDSVQEAFDLHGIKYVKVDWTNRDAEATHLLEQFGRYGVPMYVYYPRMGDPVVLPQVLTPDLVINQLIEDQMVEETT